MTGPRRCSSFVLLLAFVALFTSVSLGQNPVELRVTAPSRMINDKTLTLKAELFDSSGNLDWQVWAVYGTVTATRVADKSVVPVTITYFEEHDGVPPSDSIRFYNGKGSVSLTLDNGSCVPPGEINVSVSVLGVTGSKIVTVLDDPPVRALSGDISGDLHWSPADGVIHLTGNVSWGSGELLIEPGTLIMIDPSVDFDLSTGDSISAVGTEDDPIYFFPTTGPPALVLPNICATSCDGSGGTRNNPEAWGQIRHTGSASSVFDYVIMVGGGNGSTDGHTRPPLLRFADSSRFELRNSVLADIPGKAILGKGTGIYTIDRSLITRCGHGAEFDTSGWYTLRILNSWFTGIGRGPGFDRCGNDCGFDGDMINPRSPGDILIKGCILTDGGDEAIDGARATITVEDTIIYRVRDKAMSDDVPSAHTTFRNCLIFANGSAFGPNGTRSVFNSTIYGGGGFWEHDNIVHMSIIWPQVLNGCPGTFTYNLIGGGTTLQCDPSNFTADPLFVRLAAPNPDFDLQPTSPAIHAGPNGERIGWLGFPTGETCASDADCDDADACTIDTCRSGVCRNELEVGCVSCQIDADCERDPQCAGACSAGICVYGGSCDDGLSCTSSDSCVGGFCVGENDCPQGQVCDQEGDICQVVPVTLSFQQGLDGYSGTRDAYIYQTLPDQSFGEAELVRWADHAPGTPVGEGKVVGLIRFEEIFGTGLGQIPVPGDEINSAVLEYFTYNPEDPGNPGGDGELREAYIDWSEQVSWNSFGAEPGPQNGEYGPILTIAPGNPLGDGNSKMTLDVTSSIRAWADDPSQNKGWVLTPQPDGEFSTAIWSSEAAIEATTRPRLVVTYGAESPFPDVIRQPYLQKAAPTSMTIVWKTSLKTDSRVSFGTSPGVFDQTVLDPSVTTDHVVTLTGLTPDTTYYYEVGSEEQFHAGGCVDHYFKTPPPTGTPAHFKIWAFSDSGIHSVHQYRVRDAMLNRAGSHPPDVIIHSGDVDQTTPTDARYTVHHFDVYNEILSHTAMYPTVGNHDGYTSDSNDGSGPYFDAFVIPTAGESGGLASGTESYYSFDYANVHFVVLDSDGGNIAPDSPMLTWLEADLAATDQQWLIAYWHHPPYSFGSHDSNDGYDSGGRLRNMRELFVPVLEAGGVDLVFTGHSHLLERSFLISGAYGYGDFPHKATPDFETLLADGHIIDSGDGRTNGSGAYVKSPFLQEYGGTVYMTLSSGGQTLDLLPDSFHPVMYTTKRIFGSALIDINGNELTLEWISEHGSREDYFSIVKPCIDDTDCEDSRFCNGAATCNAGNCEAGVDPCDAEEICNEALDLCQQVDCVLDLDCDDENPCTDDFCNANTCEYGDTSGACDDGDLCTVADQCVAGLCSGNVLDCSGLNDACNVGVCNPSSGSCETLPANEGGSCDDGLDCTAADACTSGVCVGAETCPPGEFCNPQGGCAAAVELLFRDDGVYGGTQDTFVLESAPDSNRGAEEHWEWDSQNGTPAGQNYGMIGFDDIVGDSPERIPPGAIVISAYLRLVVWDESAAPPAELRESLVDWNEATETWNSFGGEPGIQADELGAYVADAPVAIGTFDIDVTASVQAWVNDPASNRGWIVVPHSNDGVHVHSAEYAVVADRPALIVQVLGAECDGAAECDDGNFCNGAETCDSGVCQSGSPVTCDDGNLCTDDSCDAVSGCVFVNNTAPCDDENACSMDDACSAGTCTGGSALTCDDGNLCTDDSCDAVSGCVFVNNTAPCDDENACSTDDACSAGTCTGGSALICDDGNLCTDDSCDAVSGCVFVNNTAPCDDENACSMDDACSAGTCTGGSALTCDDGNLCTDDSCDAVSGCVFVNNTAPCDDENACSTDDACSAGTCTGGSALTCDDGNLCTDDSCDPIAGCIYTNNVVSCDDGDVCTEDDFCSEGTCAGTAVAPDEVGNVQMHEGASLTWDDHGAGITYDVAGGTLSDLWADGSVVGAVCLETGVGEAGFTDPRPDPPAGGAYYYVVRLRGECGPGTYGQSSAGGDRLPLNGCP